MLVTDEVLDWIADPELRPFLVVSEALVRLLYEGDNPIGELAAFGAEMTPGHLVRLRDVLGQLERFSGDLDDIPDGARTIRDNLIASSEPLAEVLADEWVFITTQSIGIFRAAKNGAIRAFEAFRRIGGDVQALTDELMERERGLNAVHDKLPPKLLKTMKAVGKVGPHGRTQHFLALGGTIALLCISSVGGPVGIALAVQQGVAFIAGDP